MPEPATSTNEPTVPVKSGCTGEHTCACGEKHEHQAGTISHQESCTSPLKFGDSCCCQPGDDAKTARHPCGHGPRCH